MEKRQIKVIPKEVAVIPQKLYRENLTLGKEQRPESCGQNDKLLRFPNELSRIPKIVPSDLHNKQGT